MMIPRPLLAFVLASIACGSAPAQDLVSSAPATEVRDGFLKLIDRPRIPLDSRAEPLREGETEKEAPRVLERLSFAAEKRADGSLERVPALVLRPEADPSKPRRPAVIVLHGTGGNKEGSLPWLRDLARCGILGLAIDGRYHGERAGGLPGTEAYNEAIVRAFRTAAGQPQEHPFYFDTAWDVMRAVDYLRGRPDIDPDRIGLIGFSKGGIEAWLAGAADERILVTVPAISVQSFRWSLDHGQWQARANTIKVASEAVAKDLGKSTVDAETCRALWDKVIPHILDAYDCPSMLRLFAGRPLLILNGEEDPNCPIGGAEVAFRSARKAYEEQGASDRLRIHVAPKVAHQVTSEQAKEARDWFVRWLKP
ncbi:MAG: dienelactone hydrolase family protein [Isosphaeraceae bacterium]